MLMILFVQVSSKVYIQTITFKIIQVNESSNELRGSVFNACSQSFVTYVL